MAGVYPVLISCHRSFLCCCCPFTNSSCQFSTMVADNYSTTASSRIAAGHINTLLNSGRDKRGSSRKCQ